jgi:hypothetical protein
MSTSMIKHAYHSVSLPNSLSLCMFIWPSTFLHNHPPRHHDTGKGKLTWPFSAQRRQISAPRQLALHGQHKAEAGHCGNTRRWFTRTPTTLSITTHSNKGLISDIQHNDIMLNVVVLIVAICFCYAECHYAECCGASSKALFSSSLHLSVR